MEIINPSNVIPLQNWGIGDLLPNDVAETFTGSITVDNGKSEVQYAFSGGKLNSIAYKPVVEKKETK